MTHIVSCDPESVAIGMKVTVDFAEVESGAKYGTEGGTAIPRFRPR
jgi:uncharacterized OB-fold protein